MAFAGKVNSIFFGHAKLSELHPLKGRLCCSTALRSGAHLRSLAGTGGPRKSRVRRAGGKIREVMKGVDQARQHHMLRRLEYGRIA
jgi:hypothetical protein